MKTKFYFPAHTPHWFRVEIWVHLFKRIVFCVKISVLLLIINVSHAQTAYRAMEVTYIGLQVADLHLTYKGIHSGAIEANPVARWAIDNHMLIPGKVLTTSAFLYLTRRIYLHDHRLGYVYLTAGNLIYSAVVFHNYQICLRLKI